MLRIPEVKAQAAILRTMFAELGVTLSARQAMDRVARMNGHKNYQVMEKQSRHPSPAKVDVNQVRYNAAAQVYVLWSIRDVLYVRPDLTDDQALDVLHKAKHELDAEVGINNESLRTAARDFPKWRMDVELIVEGSNEAQPYTLDLSNGRLYRRTKGATGAELYWPAEEATGEIRIGALPDETFEVEAGEMLNECPESLHALCCELRELGLTPDTAR